MLLQMAMDGAADGLTIAEFKEFISNIYDSVDIVEFGTSCVYRFGMEGVQEIKQAFPDKLILADMKIMDGGGHMSRMAYSFGADIVTVLAVSDDATIGNVIGSAHKVNKEVMVDMICVSDIAKRIPESLEEFSGGEISILLCDGIPADNRWNTMAYHAQTCAEDLQMVVL